MGKRKNRLGNSHGDVSCGGSQMKRNWSYFMGGLCIYLIIAAYGWVLKDIIPASRTYFVTYQSFNKVTDWTLYPKVLPKSAHDVHYYYYEAFLTDKSGYRASFSQEDYELLKENRLEAYHLDDMYRYSGGSKQYLDRERLKQQKITFIDKILPVEKDDGNYYFLAYDLYEDDRLYSYDGVLCNDEICGIVQFTWHGPN